MGKPCAQNFTMHIHNPLEGYMGFREDLLRLLFAGIAYKRYTGLGATLCRVTASIYIYSPSPLYRPNPRVAREVFPPRASASPSYLESILTELSMVPLGSACSTPRRIYLGLGKCYPPTSARISRLRYKVILNHSQDAILGIMAFRSSPFSLKPVLQAHRVPSLPLYCFALESNHIASLTTMVVAHSEPLLMHV